MRRLTANSILPGQNTRPDHNPIVAGNWPPKADEVSMEEGWRNA